MNRTAVGRFDPSTKNSYSVSVYIIALNFLITAGSVNSACVKTLEFADIIFILFVSLCDCRSAAPISMLEALHIA